MYREPVGVSILTNANRLPYLKECVRSLLENCYYRPLVIGVYDNGSTDDTWAWLQNHPEAHGVSWKIARVLGDQGCAHGQNRVCEMMQEFEYCLHLENDFIHITPEESGHDKLWLNRALELMETKECNFLYLRRMRNEQEMMMHWWSQWMPKIDRQVGEFMRCPGFWWSHNPHLRRTEAIYRDGCLPLDVTLDGQKGTKGWSQPELQAPRPTKTWIHQWGLFVHERLHVEYPKMVGCDAFGPYGTSSCKYGFWKPSVDRWCDLCNRSLNFSDMQEHDARFQGVR